MVLCFDDVALTYIAIQLVSSASGDGAFREDAGYQRDRKAFARPARGIPLSFQFYAQPPHSGGLLNLAASSLLKAEHKQRLDLFVTGPSCHDLHCLLGIKKADLARDELRKK